jgi:hypothetical protein
MEQTGVVFKVMLASGYLSGHCAEFGVPLQLDHINETSPAFEMGVVKIMKGMSEGVTGEEQQDCECLLKMEWPKLYPTDEEEALKTDSCNSPSSSSSFNRLMPSSLKCPHSETALRSKHNDLSFLSPTLY